MHDYVIENIARTGRYRYNEIEIQCLAACLWTECKLKEKQLIRER